MSAIHNQTHKDGWPGGGAVWWFAIILLVSNLSSAMAQGRSQPELSIEAIEARVAELQAAADQPASEAALSAYRQALADLEQRRRFQDQSRELEAAGIEAPRRQDELREEIVAARKETPELILDGEESLEDVEQALALARAELLAADQGFERLTEQVTELRSRPELVEQRLADASDEADQLQAELDAASLSQPQATAARARLAALTAEMEFLEQDLLTQPARLGLLEARRDQAALVVERARNRVNGLQQALAERRGAEAERTLAASGAGALSGMTDSELIDQTLERNETLATELAALSGLTRAAAADNSAVQQQLDSLRRRFDSAREKIAVVGLSPALGRFLQAERRDLPEPRSIVLASREREDRIAAAGLRGLQLEEALEDWRSVDQRTDELLSTVRPDKIEALRSEIVSVVQARRDLLRQLVAANNDYLRTLSELETNQRQALQVVRSFGDFLSRNLLWLRNESPLSPGKLLTTPSELVHVLQSEKWREGFRVLLAHSSTSPLQIAAYLLVILAAWKRPVVLDLLRATARGVGKPSADTMASTLKALAYTLILALPWPALAAITGLLMNSGPMANAASAVFGDALLRMAPFLYLLLLVRNLCLSGGVAEVHFGWRAEGLAALRRELVLLALTLLIPGVFLIIAYDFAAPDQTFGFAQLIYLVPVLGLARFLYRLLYPGRSIVERLKKRPAGAYSRRLGWAWLIGAQVLPVLMGVVAIAGFMYSASILLDRTVLTLLFALALALASELGARWLLIARRRARLQEVLARRAAIRQQEDTEPGAAAEVLPIPEAGEDLASLDADSRKLIMVVLSIVALLGVVAIWSPVLPALDNLSGITLWEYAQDVGGEQIIRPVALTDLLLALILAALTLAAARSLPAMVEIVLRQRGSVPSGSRLAFATLARYGIVMIGLGLVLSIIGVNWSKLQWLVAALGVGIGFGLQEIVANFISGLIILIERPVRVGDVVTVGEDTGQVVRIQIRATTIRKWDQQELIVPNKEFITSRVVNWSLSDDTCRIFFMIGIAYGSDVEKALRLIEEAATENAVVLEDPPPLVTFEAFGDNSLNLGLRCYVPSVKERLTTQTALHVAINRKLAEADIVIAFPQRDVHLDTTSPLEIRLRGNEDAKGTAR